MNICKNCQANFDGKYCNKCGEKIVENKDFTIYHTVSHAIGTITNFDSKIFRTLKLLFFFPGKLTIKFVEGVRVPYMKPFQIFVISNIIFFIFLSEMDLFRTPSQWYFSENFDGIRVMDIVREIATRRNLEHSEIALIYDNKSSNLAKGLIVILIPFIALIGKLLNPDRRFEFGKHLIFSTHVFSFLLLICVVNNGVVQLLNVGGNKWFYIVPITTLMALYYTISTKIFYENSWGVAIVKGIVGVVLINLVLHFYRITINLISLNSI